MYELLVNRGAASPPRGAPARPRCSATAAVALLAVLLMAACVRLDHWLRTPDAHAPPTAMVSCHSHQCATLAFTLP
jgi:hypothetical protein